MKATSTTAQNAKAGSMRHAQTKPRHTYCRPMAPTYRANRNQQRRDSAAPSVIGVPVEAVGGGIGMTGRWTHVSSRAEAADSATHSPTHTHRPATRGRRIGSESRSVHVHASSASENAMVPPE